MNVSLEHILSATASRSLSISVHPEFSHPWVKILEGLGQRIPKRIPLQNKPHLQSRTWIFLPLCRPGG